MNNIQIENSTFENKDGFELSFIGNEGTYSNALYKFNVFINGIFLKNIRVIGLCILF